MLLRFCVKITNKQRSNTYYIKAHNAQEAIKRFTLKHPTMEITKIEFIGDALPCPSKTVAQVLKEAQKANAAKRKRWIAAKKYEAKAGISPLSIRPKKS